MASESAKNLVIVESPAKAKTISRFLGPEYRVESSYGHVRDLPQNAKEIPSRLRKKEWARLGVNVDEGFEPVYVVPAQKKEHVKRLKEAMKDAGRLLLATDEDREGESISWHILELLKPPKGLPVERIVFHEVTPEAIRDALESPRAVDENLVRAQEARRVLDRLYGYSLSPLLWKRVRPGLSAGRVQSVAVRLTVERERERIAFVSSEYWDIKAEVETDGTRFGVRLARIDERRLADGKSFDSATGALAAEHRHLVETEAEGLAAAAQEASPWTVRSVERRPGQQKAAAPFTTSTLQQEANRKLRMTSKHTMAVAQQLYEGIELGDGDRVGLITYMRTDSLTLSDRALEQSRAVIRDAYGDDYLPDQPVRYRTKAKRAQEAHEAIRPTDLSRRPKDVAPHLSGDQLKVYELIWKRTIASQMVPARIERTNVEIETTAQGEALVFTASGRRIVFPGFLRAYVEGSDDPEAELGDKETFLPALTEGQEVEAFDVSADGHRTKPPYRYTEASLVKKLEEEGIGRPSTYASIISTIQDRGYVIKRGNELTPTFTAFCVTLLLEKQFADLVDTRFTAEMEDELDEVASGNQAWDDLVRGFYCGGDTDPGLVQRVEEGEVTYPEIPLGEDPETAEVVVVKVGKYGPYVRRGEGGSENAATVPESFAPDELTLEVALELLRVKSGDAPPVGTADDGRAIHLKTGRYGEYLEIEQTEDEKEAGTKPRRSSLPRGVSGSDLTPEMACKLVRLPRVIGVDPEDGAEISTAIGPYGPYVNKAKDYRSLESWEKACEIELEEALAILAQPKPKRRGRQRTVLKEIGEVEGAAGPVQLLDGRYGPYVTDGETNASLPRGLSVDTVDAAKAKELLDARRGQPKKKRARRGASKKGAKSKK
ncbi:MAG: type I DNA topoisomerase [Acidobacteriota bacterium]